MFLVHWICRIETAYLDPAYDRKTKIPADIVERETKKLTPGLWIVTDKTFPAESSSCHQI